MSRDGLVPSQTTDSVLLVRPACFFANPETAASNAFQGPPGGPDDGLLARAREEQAALARALEAQGVRVHLAQDTPRPLKPDALFPNNWVSFHPGGTVVLYPLQAPSRRAEVRSEILDDLRRRGWLQLGRLVDLRHAARALAPGAEAFLEGTGSLVLDRPGRVAYACLSPRTASGLLEVFGRELGYRVHAFRGQDRSATPIYHTNVMLSLGTRLAIACLDALRDEGERRSLVADLEAGGRELLEIDLAQLESFAGNALELRAGDGTALWVLSARALRSLRPEQHARLERDGRLVSVELETIETHGGGSARCMIAEVFR